jgi:hypothetical protein
MRKSNTYSLESKNMRINKQNTKTMIINRKEKTHEKKIEDSKLEQVKNLKYLGSIILQHGQQGNFSIS